MGLDKVVEVTLEVVQLKVGDLKDVRAAIVQKTGVVGDHDTCDVGQTMRRS